MWVNEKEYWWRLKGYPNINKLTVYHLRRTSSSSSSTEVTVDSDDWFNSSKDADADADADTAVSSWELLQLSGSTSWKRTPFRRSLTSMSKSQIWSFRLLDVFMYRLQLPVLAHIGRGDVIAGTTMVCCVFLCCYDTVIGQEPCVWWMRF